MILKFKQFNFILHKKQKQKNKDNWRFAVMPRLNVPPSVQEMI